MHICNDSCAILLLLSPNAFPINRLNTPSRASGPISSSAFKYAAKAAHEGAEATKTVVARLGRAGTVGERSIGFPDAGAHGLDVIFNELAKFIKNF